MYCPTTCGVSDYMFKYFTATNDEVNQMQQDLETINNVTRDAEDMVIYMKDSTTAAQKSITPGNATDMNPLKTSTHLGSTVHIAYFCSQTLKSKSHRACWMMSLDLKRSFLYKSSK